MPYTKKQEGYLHANNIPHRHDEAMRETIRKLKKR